MIGRRRETDVFFTKTRTARAMIDAPAETETAACETHDSETPFTSVEAALRDGGPAAAIGRLTEHLAAAGENRALLDALLLKARLELGLPLVSSGSLAGIPEPERSQYEEKYIAAIRQVGGRYLDAGDIPTAWAYYRVIAETEPVAAAIGRYRPDDNDEKLGAVIEVAFNHGVSPERGFEMILEHYGTCPAITAFDQLPPHDQGARSACAGRLIRHLHRELSANLRSEIANRGQVVPPVGTLIADLLQTRPWLLADESYHIDISHLAAVVRMSLLVDDREVRALAADLTEYGKRLSPRLLFEGPPPFEKIFDDHGIYLKGLLGIEVDQAVAHFRGKVAAGDVDDNEASIPAQTLVSLLIHVGELDAAIDVAAEHLAGLPESALSCPSLAQLCLRAGQPARLAQLARAQKDLVTFTAALIQTHSGA
jgi:hypothetical protein